MVHDTVGRVELEAGVRYQVNILGLYTGDGTLDDPMLGDITAPDGSYVGGRSNLYVRGGDLGNTPEEETRNIHYAFTAD